MGSLLQLRLNSQEVGFECLNSAFGAIPAVDVWWNQLEFNASIGGDGLLVGFAGIVVQNLKVYDQLAILEALHDCIVGYHSMPIRPSLEGHS